MGRWVWWSAVGLAFVGGVVGAVNAVVAMLTVGGSPGYSERLWAAIAALLLAVLAGAVPIFLSCHCVLAAGLILLCAVAGTVAINLFYIETFYIAALPAWSASALFALGEGTRPEANGTPRL